MKPSIRYDGLGVILVLEGHANHLATPQEAQSNRLCSSLENVGKYQLFSG